MPSPTPHTRPLTARQPIKALYILYALSTTLFLHLPFAALTSLLPSFRPHPQWTFAQSLMNSMFNKFLIHLSNLEVKPPITLSPGAEKDRFVIMEGVEERTLGGVARSEVVKPGRVGGTWYPERMDGRWEEQSVGRKGGVVLMFHGGAYVMATGRDETCAGAANLLTKALPNIRVLAVDYRLSSYSGCHFPAALQDAISAYSYLLNEKGVPASKIVLCGDSAGGNLCLALLRYVSEQGQNETGISLPWPVGAMLWSPWLNLTKANDPKYTSSKTDYISHEFAGWGVSTLVGPSGLSVDNPYISPARHPFACKTALWMMAGGLEVLYDDIVEFKEGMEGKAEVVLYVERWANHDIFLVGDRLAFQAEREKCIGIAADWMVGKGVGSRS